MTTAEDMICTLANVCNYATQQDGTGFSKVDANFGHSLADHARQGKTWTKKQADAALKLIRKYQRQLGGKAFVDSWIANPVFRNDPVDTSQAKKSKNRQLVSKDTVAIFKFDYDTDLITAIKSKLKGEHRGKKYWPLWNPDIRAWTVLVNETSIWQIMDIANQFEFDIEPRFTEYLEKVQEKTAESKTMLNLNNNMHVTVTRDQIVVAVADAAILKEFERVLG